MRTYLAPLGFDSRRVIRPVLGEGLSEGDQVVLLQPSNTSKRGEDAVGEVEEILTQVVPGLEIRVENLPYADFVETTLSCADLIRQADGEVIVILGGGARELLLPLTTAVFSSTDEIDTILQIGDIDSSVRQIPKINLRATVSDAEAALLESVSTLETPLSISEIARETEKSKSTVARHVDALESEGFVTTTKSGRTKSVEVTDSGRVFLKTRRRNQI